MSFILSDRLNPATLPVFFNRMRKFLYPTKLHEEKNKDGLFMDMCWLAATLEEYGRSITVDDLWRRFAITKQDISEKTQISFGGALGAAQFLGIGKAPLVESLNGKKFVFRRAFYGSSSAKSTTA